MLTAINLHVPLQQQSTLRRQHSPWRPGKAPPVSAGLLDNGRAASLAPSQLRVQLNTNTSTAMESPTNTLTARRLTTDHSPLVIKHDTDDTHRPLSVARRH